MAICRTINIDGVDVKFKASAAIPRLYRLKFHRDIYRDLNALKNRVDENGDDVAEKGSNLDMLSLEMFEDVAWLMAYHADPTNVETEPDEWLEQFNTFSIYEILPQLIDLWGLNMETQVEAKKNIVKVSGR